MYLYRCVLYAHTFMLAIFSFSWFSILVKIHSSGSRQNNNILLHLQDKSCLACDLYAAITGLNIRCTSETQDANSLTSILHDDVHRPQVKNHCIKFANIWMVQLYHRHYFLLTKLRTILQQLRLFLAVTYCTT